MDGSCLKSEDVLTESLRNQTDRPTILDLGSTRDGQNDGTSKTQSDKEVAISATPSNDNGSSTEKVPKANCEKKYKITFISHGPCKPKDDVEGTSKDGDVILRKVSQKEKYEIKIPAYHDIPLLVSILKEGEDKTQKSIPKFVTAASVSPKEITPCFKDQAAEQAVALEIEGRLPTDSLLDPSALQDDLERTLGMVDFQPFIEDSTKKTCTSLLGNKCAAIMKVNKNVKNQAKNIQNTINKLSVRIKSNFTVKSMPQGKSGGKYKDKDLRQNLGRCETKIREVSREELLEHTYLECLKKWREYINMDNNILWRDELNNALEYAYTEDALEMICFRDTSVWQIIEDMAYGPSKL